MKRFFLFILTLLNFNFNFSQNNYTIKVVKEEQEYSFDTTIITNSVDTIKRAFNGLYILESPVKKSTQRQYNYHFFVYFHRDSAYIIKDYKHRNWLLNNQDKDSNRKERKREKILRKLAGKKYILEVKTTLTNKYLVTISGDSESTSNYDQKEEQLKRLIIGESYLTIKENPLSASLIRGVNPGSILIDTINGINLIETNRLYRTSSKVRFRESNEYKYEFLEFDFSDFNPNIKYYTKNNSYEFIDDTTKSELDITLNINNVYILKQNNVEIVEIKLRKKSILITKKYPNCFIQGNSFKAKNYNFL